MKALISMSNNSRPRFRQLSSFPPSEQIDNDEADIRQSLKEVDARFGRSKIDDEMNSSMALNTIEDEAHGYSMPLKEAQEQKTKKPKGRRRLVSPVRSILRNGSARTLEQTEIGGPKKVCMRAQSDKRLSFALSPTFISDPNIKIDLGQDSMISLDSSDIFPNEESSKGEGSLVLSPPPTTVNRRSSLTQFKSKSSQGFDERFVDLNESDLSSSNGNFSTL
jgi:hypothetical protein